MITEANKDLQNQLTRLEASLKAQIVSTGKAADARITKGVWSVGVIVTIATAVLKFVH